MKKALLLALTLVAVAPVPTEAQRVRSEWDGVRAWVRTGPAQAMYTSMFGLRYETPDVDAFTRLGRSYGIPQSFNRDGSMSGGPSGRTEGRWMSFSVERRGEGRFRCFAEWDADAFYWQGEREGNGRPTYIGFPCQRR